MLDKSKLIAQLHKVADELFVDTNAAYLYAQTAWNAIIHDPLFIYKVREVQNLPWPVPLWKGDLSQIIEVSRENGAHVVLSVDGSQIYPDRHNVASCFLINTGSVVLPYCMSNRRVELYSTPIVFVSNDTDQLPLTTDTVNCKRQELELGEGLILAQRVKNECKNKPLIILFDGSLIFWHLSSQDKDISSFFLHAYCSLLDQLHNDHIVSAWYISSPKSKELINLIRLHLCNFDPDKKEMYEMVNKVVDSTIMEYFLKPYTRTILFRNRSSISFLYPQHLQPFFFYIHTGNEIGRVEIPAWIAKDDALVDDVARIILDQCIKGNGYPVALAEAHEQAVVKGPDREFFYHFLQKMIVERGKHVAISRKSLKKRGIGI